MLFTMQLPCLQRPSLALAALPLSALILGGCAPPPDFPLGADVVIQSVVEGAAEIGTLEHVSSDWVVLRGADGQHRYYPIPNVVSTKNWTDRLVGALRSLPT